MARTGKQALQLCEAAKPDVVLMDLLMPEMDGLTATMAIREELPATQVLVVSGLPGEPRDAEALRAGAIGYLRKDVDAEELRRGASRTCWPGVASGMSGSARSPQRTTMASTSHTDSG